MLEEIRQAIIGHLKEECPYLGGRVFPFSHPRQMFFMQTLKTPFVMVTPSSDTPYLREKPQRDLSEYVLVITIVQSQEQFGKQSSVSTDPVSGGLIAMAKDIRNKLAYSTFGAYGASLDILPALHISTQYGDPGFDTNTGAHGAANITISIKEC